MAASPYYKVTTPEHGYCASFKYAEDAAQFAATHAGAIIRNRWGKVLWDDHKEPVGSYDSFDAIAEIMSSRDGGTINPNT